jgi:flagellar hook-basal body complex protein FliE
VQHEADNQSLQLAAGMPVDLHDVMIAQDRAALSMDLAIQVRNKLVESYHEIMRMQM